MPSLGQRGSVGQKVSIAGFLDSVGHLGGVERLHDLPKKNLESILDSKKVVLPYIVFVFLFIFKLQGVFFYWSYLKS